MKRYPILLLLPALAFTGCGNDDETAATGFGRVAFSCLATVETLSRTDVDVPAQDEFALAITGEDYSESWPQLADFVSADPLLAVGTYRAVVSWGDPQDEGFGKPCYTGATDFTVVSNDTVEAAITARLGNAQVKVTCTDRFRGYFRDARFTLTTSAGNSFPFSDQTEDAVFVRAESGFALSGSAVKQNGTKILFSEQTIERTKAQALYDYTFDVSSAGSVAVIVSLNDKPIAEIEVDVELNPSNRSN